MSNRHLIGVVLALLLVVPVACGRHIREAREKEQTEDQGDVVDDGSAADAPDPTAETAPPSTASGGGGSTTTSPPPTAPAGLTETRALSVDGVERSYTIHVPDDLPAGEAVPLVVGLHGGLGSGHQFETANHVDAMVDQQGFIAVYPDGTTNDRGQFRTWNGGYCCGPAMIADVDDLAFIRALVAETEAEFPVDPDRVFAMGHSNGGIMAYRLACEASDVFAAIGVVAGSLGGVDCRPTAPVSVLHIHGDADTNHPIDGGRGTTGISGVTFNSAYDTVGEWAGLDSCSAEPVVTTEEGNGGAYEQRTWTGCAADAEVVFDILTGAAHAWPGSTPNRVMVDVTGRPSTLVDATELIGEFFSAHGRS